MSGEIYMSSETHEGRGRPVRFEGPEEHVWSSEGVSHPAWRVVVVYEKYDQEFWFMNEQAASKYIADLQDGTEVRA
jgi:hypothetical protein